GRAPSPAKCLQHKRPVLIPVISALTSRTQTVCRKNENPTCPTPSSNPSASKASNPFAAPHARSASNCSAPRTTTFSSCPPTTSLSTCSPIPAPEPCPPTSGPPSWKATKATPAAAASIGSATPCRISSATSTSSPPTRAEPPSASCST